MRDGSLHAQMRGLKNFAKNKKSDFKVIIMFNSVSDSLFNNDEEVPGNKKVQVKGQTKSENDF